MTKRTEEVWQQYYSELTEYINNNGCLPPYAERRLFKWMHSQRARYLGGCIKAHHVQLLEKLPVWKWRLRVATWDRFYNELTQKISRGEKLGGALSKWIYKQKAKFHEGKLEAWKIQKLSCHDFWSWTIAEHRKGIFSRCVEWFAMWIPI